MARPRRGAMGGRPGSRRGGVPALALAGLLLLIASGSAAAGGLAPVAGGVHPTGALALSADPSVGTAPLLVVFRATTANGSAPQSLAWSFGDGDGMNQSGTIAESPVHEYLSAGLYHCTVTARWASGGDTSASIDIVVRSPTLRATIHADPPGGPAPLTVWFNSSVDGGSGTYVAYDWAFGDGGLGSGLSFRYTYGAAGTYDVTFNATDSLGDLATTSASILVTSAASGPSGGGGFHPVFGLTDPLVLLVLAAVVVSGAVGYLSVRPHRSLRSPPSEPTDGRTTGAAPEGPGAPGAPWSPPPGIPSERSPAAGSMTFPTPRRAGFGPDGPRGVSDALLRHLAGLPRLRPGDLPSRRWTQAGIAEAVGAGQSAVSRVLQRLVAGGYVRVETRHVAGSARRQRVYLLTDRGEEVGRSLRPFVGDGGRLGESVRSRAIGAAGGAVRAPPTSR